MAAPRTANKYITSPGFTAIIKKAADDVDGAEMAFERMVQEFVDQCREERTEARIRARAEAGEARRSGVDQDKVITSPYILSYRCHSRSLELYWAKVVYLKGGGAPVYRRVPCENLLTSLRVISAKAHPQELDVIVSHEMQARRYRLAWNAYIAARRQITNFANGLDT